MASPDYGISCLDYSGLSPLLNYSLDNSALSSATKGYNSAIILDDGDSDEGGGGGIP